MLVNRPLFYQRSSLSLPDQISLLGFTDPIVTQIKEVPE